jgi:cytochrome c
VVVRWVAAGVALVLVVGAAPAMWAWAQPPRPESDRVGSPPLTVAQAGAQVERGKALFAANCAKCHGDQGHGTNDGPRLVGSGNGLALYESTPKLYDFIRGNMPEESPGSLKDEEYWDTLAFILDANGLLPPNITLGPETAETVKLSP